jgi:tRNA-splicing ligase RtcB (3'-phosphate/5'-hydroxy nucleic acid ligase)
LQIIDDIPVWGTPVDEGALSQIKTCRRTADKVALMADHHKGYAVPIGGVVAYENAISPSGVGFDIACGNKAVRLDADAEDVRRNIQSIMDDLWKGISFGIGRKNEDRSVKHAVSEFLEHAKEHPAWTIKHVKGLKDLAAEQLGTVGSGNHYVDIFVDEQDRVWIGVHFGSRGFGHKIATYFLERGGAKDGMDVEPCVLSTETQLGQDYIEAMRLAGDYAYAGRDWVCSRVAKLIGAEIVEEVHNHHNFAWREEHDGQQLWVVRKGATPAFPGQKGFVGGTMAETSVILEGVESELGKQSLYSTVHGAGRVMGRMEARGKMKNGKWLRQPKVKQEDMEGQLKSARVVLRGGGLDEAPQCYKRLPEVLAEHGDMIRVLHTLTPLGVAMAGANEFDPYKD